MDLILNIYENLGPFEIKVSSPSSNEVAQENSLSYLNAGAATRTGRDRAARRVLSCSGSSRSRRANRVLDLAAGRGGMPKAKGIAGRLEAC